MLRYCALFVHTIHPKAIRFVATFLACKTHNVREKYTIRSTMIQQHKQAYTYKLTTQSEV